MIRVIRPQLHPFAWGSTTAIQKLLGLDVDGHPVAEAWFGGQSQTEPDHPAPVEEWPSLDQVISADETAVRGARLSDDPRHRFPFLVKFLAAAWPLSIQVHPSSGHAAAGYERENSAGIPLDDPTRVYRDPNAKPEAILALERFELLAGLRTPDEAADLIDALGVTSLSAAVQVLRSGGDDVMRQVVADLCAHDPAALDRVVDEITDACRRRPPQGHEAVCHWIAQLGSKFPGDVGVVFALLMNYLVLEPFDLTFVPVGMVHSYLGGLGLEVMGNSDNVVRGGLTIKHIDVDELLRLLDTTPGLPYVVRCPPGDAAVTAYDVPTDAFALTLVQVSAGGCHEVAVTGPEIVVVLHGDVAIEGSADGSVHELTTGGSAFVGTSAGGYRLVGSGRVARITVG